MQQIRDEQRPLTVWTIGHSNRSWDEFTALLAAHRIEAIADVRRFAGSRKHPQFSQDALRIALPEIGVDYLPVPEIGGRRRPRADSPNTAWRNESFRGYADHMETPEFSAGISGFLDVAERRRTALMCSEAVWWRCHRSMIADRLKAAGITVLHIMGAGVAKEHPYTSAAHLVGGKLSYAAVAG
ncbi:MAG: DUF488 domain-containing protein [Burkholderiales bacterium]